MFWHLKCSFTNGAMDREPREGLGVELGIFDDKGAVDNQVNNSFGGLQQIQERRLVGHRVGINDNDVCIASHLKAPFFFSMGQASPRIKQALRDA